jgi:hypothetical protein
MIWFLAARLAAFIWLGGWIFILYRDRRAERARGDYWRSAFYEQAEHTMSVYRHWSESIREDEGAWPPPPPPVPVDKS